MSTSARPSTPVAQSSPSTPQTGTWRHPKLDEIVRRQNATTFSDRNVKKILYNVGGIIAAFFLARSLWDMYAASVFTIQ
jgi:nucleoporin POM34